MLFKKTPVQGNYILSNGEQVLFDSQGYFETEDENVISQIKPIYQEVKEREGEKVKDLPKATPGLVGAGTSATLVATAQNAAQAAKAAK